MKQKIIKASVFMCLVLLVLGFALSDTISVSNTVNGRELPIYSVETDEKKVALSFDAAWGDAGDGLKYNFINYIVRHLALLHKATHINR